MEKEEIQIISYDESNNGNFPVYFVGVFSTNLLDLVRHENPLLNKKNAQTKKTAKKVFEMLDNRKYTFLEADESDLDRIPRKELPGIVMASLIDNELDFDKIDHLYLLFDGRLKTSQRLFTKEIFNDLYGIKRDSIHLWTEKNLDKKYKGVNLADKLAYYFFRYGGSAEKKSKMLERKVLIK